MRYTKYAALKLIKDMKFCTGRILHTCNNLVNSTMQSETWKDKKYAEFCEHLSEILLDIENGVLVSEDYCSHLDNKIKELD